MNLAHPTAAAGPGQHADRQARSHAIGGPVQGNLPARTLTVWAIWFCSYSVIYGLTTWMPSIFRTVYNVSIQQSVSIGFLNSAAGVVGALIAVLSIDVIGRKPLFVGGQLLCAVPLLILALGSGFTLGNVQGLVIAGFFFISTLAISLSTYTAELYRTELRALGCGIGNAWLRLASVIALTSSELSCRPSGSAPSISCLEVSRCSAGSSPCSSRSRHAAACWRSCRRRCNERRLERQLQQPRGIARKNLRRVARSSMSSRLMTSIVGAIGPSGVSVANTTWSAPKNSRPQRTA